jgi:hypothetical protein
MFHELHTKFAHRASGEADRIDGPPSDRPTCLLAALSLSGHQDFFMLCTSFLSYFSVP